MEQKLETRNIPMQGMRAIKTEDGDMIIEGYAIIYNKEADIWGDIEMILPGASTEALKTKNQYYLWQHDPSMPLASVPIGTLETKEDEKGVFIRAKVIDTQVGRDCYGAIDSGLVDGQSFCFQVKDAHWVIETIDGVDIYKRIISKFEVIPEFSAVTFPAYEETTLQARSKELALRNKPKPEASGQASAAVLEVLKDARDNSEMRKKLNMEELNA